MSGCEFLLLSVYDIKARPPKCTKYKFNFNPTDTYIGMTIIKCNHIMCETMNANF